MGSNQEDQDLVLHHREATPEAFEKFWPRPEWPYVLLYSEARPNLDFEAP